MYKGIFFKRLSSSHCQIFVNVTRGQRESQWTAALGGEHSCHEAVFLLDSGRRRCLLAEARAWHRPSQDQAGWHLVWGRPGSGEWSCWSKVPSEVKGPSQRLFTMADAFPMVRVLKPSPSALQAEAHPVSLCFRPCFNSEGRGTSGKARRGQLSRQPGLPGLLLPIPATFPQGAVCPKARWQLAGAMLSERSRGSAVFTPLCLHRYDQLPPSRAEAKPPAL